MSTKEKEGAGPEAQVTPPSAPPPGDPGAQNGEAAGKGRRDFSRDARYTMDPKKLKERSVRGGAITVIDQVLHVIVTMASVVVLARLLTPEDYGIVAMVTAITGVVNLFRELGLSSATIQTKNITHEQVSALFWINVALGSVITLLIAASGPVLAWFYHKPQLTLVAVGISSTSVLSSLGTQHGALLNRQMRFAMLAVIRVSAILAGFIAALIIALAGGTYWALVVSSVVTALWGTAGRWMASGFRPSLPKRGTRVRPLVKFGAHIAGADIANYFHRNSDNILIGRAWGAQQLGLYNKAYALLMMPITNLRYPLNRVAFPAMSRLQNNPGPFRSYFMKYCGLISFITMPIVVFLYIGTEQVIRLVLGPRWIGAAPLFSILALVSFIQAASGLMGTAQLALGMGARYFRLSLYTAVAAIISFFIGLPWGARGVAIGYCISTYATLHPLLVYSFRNTPLRPADFYKSVMRPAIASLVMGGVLFLLEKRIGGLHDAPFLIVLFLAGLPIYLGVMRLIPGGKAALASYWDYLTILMKGVGGVFSRSKPLPSPAAVPVPPTETPEDVESV